MLVRGDGVSGGGTTKKKTTTTTAKTPAQVLAGTALGQQMAASFAKNVGVTVPKTLSVAASDAAKANAANAAAYASRSADMQAAAASANAKTAAMADATKKLAVTASKPIGSTAITTPTFLETAFANVKAAPTRSLLPNAAPTPTPSAPRNYTADVGTLSGGADYLDRVMPSASAKTPSATTPATPSANPNNSYNKYVASQITDPVQYMADQNPQMQWDAYNAVTQRRNSAAGTPASSGGSGGGSGGSSGGSSGSGAVNNVVTPSLPTFTYDDAPSSGSGTGTAGASGTGTINLPTKEENTYLSDLVNSRFEYDPATDQGYLQACAATENSIIQSIIGRGGMYSSVAQSAVATKLSDLAIEYEKAAYDRYTSERTYKMQLAQFEQDRIDTAYDEAFAAMKYQNDYAQQQYENYINSEQQKFENQLNLAQFQFTLDKEAFDQNQTIAAANLAAQKSYSSSQASSAKAATATQDADVQTQLYNLQVQKSKFNQYKTQWANSGRASKEVASYFSAYGVSVGASISDFTDVVNGVENSINNQIYSLSQQAIEIGEGKFASQFMDDYTKPATAIQSGTSADTSTSAQTNFYYQTLNQLTGPKVTAKQTAQLIKDLTTNSKYSAYQTKMGSYYFGKLLDALNAQKIALQKSSSSSSVFS